MASNLTLQPTAVENLGAFMQPVNFGDLGHKLRSYSGEERSSVIIFSSNAFRCRYDVLIPFYCTTLS